QVAALEDLRRRLAEQRESRRGERDSFQALIIDALRRPDFDRGDLSQILEQRRAQGGDMILDMTEDLHGFLAGLTPDQKAAFLERAERERDFLRHLLFPPRPRPDGNPRR
ncbi:MAG TPA: Spy/CpxP family protein refolding chaperone, partial [Kiloniellaceae bacterium]